MSLLYVTEYAGIDRQAGGTIGLGLPLASYAVNFSAGAAYSPAFGRKTRAIRLIADAVCSFVVSPKQQVTFTSTGAALGTANNGAPAVSGYTTDVAPLTPTAPTTGNERLAANEERWLEVGPDLCIGAITNT